MATSRLFTMLTRLPEFRAMSQQDLTKLGWATKERIYVVLLGKLVPESKLAFIVDHHKTNQKGGTAAGVKPKPNTVGFRTAFAKAAARDIKSIGDAPITAYTEIMSENRRAENHQTIAWLLERIHLKKKAEAKSRSPFGSARSLAAQKRAKKAAGFGDQPQPAPSTVNLDITDTGASTTAVKVGSAAGRPIRPGKKLASKPSSVRPAPERLGRGGPVPDPIPDAGDGGDVGLRSSSDEHSVETDMSSDDGEPDVASPNMPTAAAAGRTTQKRGTRSMSVGHTKLAADHRRLAADHQHLRSIYDQLVGEDAAESFDRRRLALLKSQNVQLERQVVLQAEALDTRADALQHVENLTVEMQSIFSTSTATELSTPRSAKALGKLALEAQHLLEKARAKCAPESTRLPFYFTSKFTAGDPMLLDICTGSALAIDPAMLSKLESSLVDVSERMVTVQATLGAAAVGNGNGSVDVILAPIKHRLDTEITALRRNIQLAARELLSLTVLLPAAAPANPMRRGDVCAGAILPTAEEALARFPEKARKKEEIRNQVRWMTEAAGKAIAAVAAENEQLRAELDVHWKLHGAHGEYANGVCRELDNVERLRQHDSDNHHAELNEVLAAYDRMTDTISEAELVAFLAAFKRHADKLRDLEKALEPTKLENVRMTSSVVAGKRVSTRASELSSAFSVTLESLEAEMRATEAATAAAPPPPPADFRF